MLLALAAPLEYEPGGPVFSGRGGGIGSEVGGVALRSV